MFKMIVATIKITFFIVLFSYVFNEFCRIAAHDGIRCHILGYYSASGHDSVLADGHARQDGGSCTNLSVLTDVDGLAEENLSVI